MVLNCQQTNVFFAMSTAFGPKTEKKKVADLNFELGAGGMITDLRTRQKI